MEGERKLRKYLVVYSASGAMMSAIGNVEAGFWGYPLTIDDVRELEKKIRKENDFTRVAIINIIPLASGGRKKEVAE